MYLYFARRAFRAISFAAITACTGLVLVLPAIADDKAVPEQDTRFLKSPGQEEYPLANAIFLIDDLGYDVNSDGTSKFYEHDAIKVLNEVGVSSYGTLMRILDTRYEDIEVVKAQTITSDGKIIKVSPKAITKVPLIDDPIYANQQLFTIEFPHCVANSVIEYELNTISKPGYVKYWSQGSFMQNLDPLLNTAFTLTVPQNTKFKWFRNSSSIKDPQKSTKDGRDVYHWIQKNEGELVSEPLMPHPINYLKSVQVTDCHSWEDLATWLGQQWDKALAQDSEFGLKITSISSNSKPKQQRIQDVLDWFAGNYTVQPDVPIYHELHTPNELLNCHTIGCNDGALLLSAILSKFGVNAYPVMITAYSKDGHIENCAPALFNVDRIILRVPNESGNDMWIDPVVPGAINAFPSAKQQLKGAVRLGCKGQQAGCFLTPACQASDYMRDISLDIMVEDRDADIALNLSVNGGDASVWRSHLIQAASLPANEREKILTWLSREINKEFSVPTVPYSFYFPEEIAAGAPLELNTTVISAGISAGTPDNEYSMPMSIFGGDSLVSLLTNQTKRTKPVSLDHPFIDEVRVHVELPKDAKITAMPKDSQVDTPCGSFRVFTRHTDREAWLYSRLEVDKSWFEVKELSQLLPLAKAQSECLSTLLKYTLPPKAKEKDSDKEKTTKKAEKAPAETDPQDTIDIPGDLP